MNQITIVFPIPSSKLAQNGRSHWRQKAKLTKQTRLSACYLALCALKMMNAEPPRWEKASCKVAAYFPTMNFPDPLNLLERCKTLIDGIQDAGIIRDDSGLWPERPTIAKDKDNPRIEITITKEA